jgi:hypothetical protein
MNRSWSHWMRRRHLQKKIDERASKAQKKYERQAYDGNEDFEED